MAGTGYDAKKVGAEFMHLTKHQMLSHLFP